MIKDLVEFVIKQFVNNPQDVSVTETESNGTLVIELHVNDADRGKVIGRDGQTIKAMRMLVNALMPANQKITLDIAKSLSPVEQTEKK